MTPRTACWLLAGMLVASGHIPGMPDRYFTNGPSGARLVAVNVQQMPAEGMLYERFLVRRAKGTEGGRFAVQVEAVEDYDSDCNEAERAAGDSTCGPEQGAGELSDQLVVSHAWAPAEAGCPGEPHPGVDSLARSEGVVVTAPQALSDADAACVVVGFGLSETADNLVQSDHVRFKLRLGVLDATAIGTPSALVSRPDTSTPEALPFMEQATPQTPDGDTAERSLGASRSFVSEHLTEVLLAALTMLGAASGGMLLRRRSAG
jgi:hypothetical protein